MAHETFEFEPLFQQTDADILRRLLDPFASHPDPEQRFAVEEGSFLYDLTAATAVEFAQAYEAINQAAAWSFLTGAVGDALDQKGIELNLPREAETFARVLVTFEGEEGAVIHGVDEPELPTRVSTTTTSLEETAFEFEVLQGGTIPAGGQLVLEAQALTAGAAGNVPAHSITQMVDPVSGVVLVTNELAAAGGLDVESDDDYRERLIDALRAAGGPGNRYDYRVWAREVAGVKDVLVFPHWEGGGTVRVVVLGPDRSIPPTSVVRAAQDYLDPSVALLAAMEPDEAWAGANLESTQRFEGGYALALRTPGIGGTVEASYDRDEHLEYLVAEDEFFVWLYVYNYAAVESVRFTFVDDAGLEAYRELLAADLPDGLPEIVRWTLAEMVVDPGFDWGSLRTLRVAATSVTSTATVYVDALRVRDADGGVGQGRAPIGAQVTVSSARTLRIDVAATIIPAPGHTVASLTESIRERLEAFFLNREAHTGVLYVTEIANVINDTNGVLSYSGVTVNGQPTSLYLGAVDVPTLGALLLT